MKLKNGILILGSIIILLSLVTCTDPQDAYQEGGLSYHMTENPTSTSIISPVPTRNPQAFSGPPALRGINLGNALDAPWPGAWGITITEDMINTIVAAGFNAIRIPVRFHVHSGTAPDFTLSDEILRSVDEVIQWGLNANLIIILDLHHYDSMMESPEDEETRFLAIWAQLAARYQEYPETLYFELLNEPSGALSVETWNNLIARSIQIIRKTNPTRTIIIDCLDFSSIDTLEQLNLPEDPHLAATFHYYKPFEFTHQGADWVAGSQNWVGLTWTGIQDQMLIVQQDFDRAVDWSNAYQIPLILGEFGVIENADDASRQNWVETVKQAAETRGIGWLYWDLCSEFGLFECEVGEWDEGLLETVIP